MAEAVEARMNMFVKCDLASGRRCHDMHQQNTNMRVPYTFFVTREWPFLLCVKREWGFIFSVIRESIFFGPRETVFDFAVIREKCIYFRVICEPTTFAGIIFHFFGEFL